MEVQIINGTRFVITADGLGPLIPSFSFPLPFEETFEQHAALKWFQRHWFDSIYYCAVYLLVIFIGQVSKSIVMIVSRPKLIYPFHTETDGQQRTIQVAKDPFYMEHNFGNLFHFRRYARIYRSYLFSAEVRRAIL